MSHTIHSQIPSPHFLHFLSIFICINPEQTKLSIFVPKCVLSPAHTLVRQSVYVPKHTAYSDNPAVDPLSINHPSHKIRNRDDPLNPVYPAEPATTCPPAHLPPPEPPQPQPTFLPIEPSAPPAEESETLVVEPSAPTAEEEASHEMTEAKKDADEEKKADEDWHQPREDAESIEEGRHAQEHRKRGLAVASVVFISSDSARRRERKASALDDIVKCAEQRWDEREASAKSAVQQLTQMELPQNDREEQMHSIDEDLTEQYEKDLRAMKDPFDCAMREQDEREAELDLLAEEGHDMKQTCQEQIQETVDLIRHEKEELLKAMAEWREEKEKERGRIDESGRIDEVVFQKQSMLSVKNWVHSNPDLLIKPNEDHDPSERTSFNVQVDWDN
ncbi:hypothetical protein BLNAU_19389 [Blattamonas nauphoetae]|uniref:Uncharacterized protein n=1 Tax=Blattamonas nauphoetae TaxID=2049346 RepID=A0ABQ9X5Q5_9EUKA|nr:hypothetical protein BLNAU_19389 [Blattamonas nauphoetae]